MVDGIEFPDPATRWQPRRACAGRSRLLDPARSRGPTTASRRPRSRDSVLYELHVGTFTRRGHVRRRDPAPARPARARRSPTIELMPVAEFPGRHGWGYDGVYISAAHDPLRRPARASQRLVDAAHARGPRGAARRRLQPRRRLRHAGRWRRSAPTSPSHYETPWGRGDELRRRATPTPSASGCCRAPSSGSATSTSTACGSTRSTRSSTPAPSTWSPRSPAACTPPNPRAVVIAESGLNDPKVRCTGGWGCDARLGRRLPPRAARAADRRPRGLLRGVRHARRPGEGVPPPARPRRHVLDVPPPPLRRARRRRRRPSAFVVFSSNHDQVGNRAFGDRLPVEARPLAAFCTLLAPFTPMLFQGEEHGERAPFQFFSDHIDEEIAVATREGRRREFAAFAEFAGEEVPDPQDAATFERSKLTREGEPAGLRDLYARAAARPRASCRPATPTRSTSTSTPAGCASRRGAVRAARQLLPARRPRAARAGRPRPC